MAITKLLRLFKLMLYSHFHNLVRVREFDKEQSNLLKNFQQDGMVICFSDERNFLLSLLFKVYDAIISFFEEVIEERQTELPILLK